MLNKILRCKEDLKRQETELHSLIVQMVGYLSTNPANNYELAIKAVAVDHFSKKIKSLEGIIFELKLDLAQAISESLSVYERKPKRTVEQLSKELNEQRKESKKYRPRHRY